MTSLLYIGLGVFLNLLVERQGLRDYIRDAYYKVVKKKKTEPPTIDV